MVERSNSELRFKNKEKPFYHKAQIHQKIAAEALSHLYIPTITLEGVGNIQKAESLLLENKRLVIISNHLSHGDAEVIYQAFKRNEFKYISEKSLFLIGEKIRKNFFARFLGRSHNGIDVWQESLPTKNKKEEKRKLKMNLQAIGDSKKALDRGRPLVVFPEGGRTDGKLKEAEPATSHFFELIGTEFILPIGIYGVEKIIPPRKIPWPKFLWKKPEEVHAVVGQPTALAPIFEQYKDCPKNERYALIINHIMQISIAPLVPPQYRGVYL